MKKHINKLLILGFVLFQTQAALSQAQLQVIHNAADPSADTVDVYVNGFLAKDNFVFRTATPFITIPGGIPANIGIAPASSVSVSDTIKNFPYTFTNGQNYVAIASGVLAPANFAVNPDGASTAFNLLIQDNIRLNAQTAGNTEFIVIHGSTDAPTVDVVVRNGPTLVDNASYGDISGYLSVQDTNYVIDITDSGQTSIVATYNVDLSLLADSSAVIFASGFLDPSTNQNGPAFGLFAALTDGSIIEFTSVSIAFLQAIHNCSDPAADSVDIYALGFLAVDNFKYRTATNFLGVPAGIPLDVGVALGNSTSIADTIRNFSVILENGKNYIAMASGVIDTSAFAANPDGKNISFNLLIMDYAKLSSVNASNVDFIAVHACTDAPTIDIKVNGGGSILVDNAAFGDATPYIPVPAASYNLDVTPGNNNTTILKTYVGDLTALNGQTAVIFASGFLDPAANQNGPSFGLWAALKDGVVFPLTDVTGVPDIGNSNNSFSLFPNPAVDYATVTFKNKAGLNQQIIVTNATGQEVGKYELSKGSNSIKIQTAGLNKGLYFIKVIGDNNLSIGKLMVD